MKQQLTWKKVYSNVSLKKKLRKENRSQEGKVKFNFPKRKKGKTEPTLSAIKKRRQQQFP